MLDHLERKYLLTPIPDDSQNYGELAIKRNAVAEVLAYLRGKLNLKEDYE